jgi:pyruvate/2-oxoglutarate dehydrogenase complex dihydrolipoamide dehydrogenase (E3) component
VVVIGGGSAGYAAARTTAAAGLSTAVIEGGREVGGLCILRGCMPTKALLYAAEVRHLARSSNVWGLRIPEAPYDFRAVQRRKATLIDDFAAYRTEQLNDGRFTFIRSKARFLDSQTLQLEDGRRLRAASFLIATGSDVASSPLPSLEEVGYLTSDTLLTRDRLPASMTVLGGGAIAVEFAQYLARFDVRTTLIQRSGQILRDFDPDAASELASALAEEGIEVITSTRLIGASREANGKTITFEHGGGQRSVTSDEVLFALGRTPNTSPLNLQAAGVELTAGGRILTDAHQRTTAGHIYAAGDCCGPHEIVHIAIQQGEAAAANIIAGKPVKSMDYRLLCSVVFTDPQVAVVGLTETQARAEGRPFLSAAYPFNDHGKSMIMNARHGFVKLLADPDNGRILGGCCVGPCGGELIHEVIVAMAADMTVHRFAAVPHYHPTLAEIWTYPAEELAEQIPLNQSTV